MPKNLTRRDFISSAGAGALGMITTNALSNEKERHHAPNPGSKRVLRLAHLTDIHVQPEKGAPEGMARALQHAQNLADKPDLVFNGGDSIMDALGADKARTN
ncbi:MAG: twin-arginine translocation signal domain-containing protein [bacterium]